MTARQWSVLRVLDVVREILEDNLAAYLTEIEGEFPGLTLPVPKSVTIGDYIPTMLGSACVTVWDSGGSELSQLGTGASGGYWDWSARSEISIRVILADGPTGSTTQSQLYRSHVAYTQAIWRCLENWLYPPAARTAGDPYDTASWIWRSEPRQQGPDAITTDPDRGAWMTAYRSVYLVHHLVRSLPDATLTPPSGAAVDLGDANAWEPATASEAEDANEADGDYRIPVDTSGIPLVLKRAAGTYSRYAPTLAQEIGGGVTGARLMELEGVVSYGETGTVSGDNYRFTLTSGQVACVTFPLDVSEFVALAGAETLIVSDTTEYLVASGLIVDDGTVTDPTSFVSFALSATGMVADPARIVMMAGTGRDVSINAGVYRVSRVKIGTAVTVTGANAASLPGSAAVQGTGILIQRLTDAVAYMDAMLSEAITNAASTVATVPSTPRMRGCIYISCQDSTSGPLVVDIISAGGFTR